MASIRPRTLGAPKTCYSRRRVLSPAVADTIIIRVDLPKEELIGHEISNRRNQNGF